MSIRFGLHFNICNFNVLRTTFISPANIYALIHTSFGSIRAYRMDDRIELSKLNIQLPEPQKDRFPYKNVDEADKRRRLAILINLGESGTTYNAEDSLTIDQYQSCVNKLSVIGYPVLMRFFAHDSKFQLNAMLSDEWRNYLQSQPSFELFRVEPFIPIPLQIEADASHIAMNRHKNLAEAIVYISPTIYSASTDLSSPEVPENVERVNRDAKHYTPYIYETFFKHLAGNGVNQYAIFPKNTAIEYFLNEDGRVGDGSE